MWGDERGGVGQTAQCFRYARQVAAARLWSHVVTVVNNAVSCAEKRIQRVEFMVLHTHTHTHTTGDVGGDEFV